MGSGQGFQQSFQRGLGNVLEITALDGTQSAQTAHLYALNIVANSGNKAVDDAITKLSDTQEAHASPDCKKTPAQKLEIEDARRRQLKRSEGMADRISTV